MRAAGFALAAALALLALPGAARADGACTRYFADGEARFGLPPGLLHAIAMVETGRSGEPWPWALNIAGHPHFPGTRTEALRLMRGTGGTLRPDMAVGCMQIHTHWHGASFTYGEDVLDPPMNVGYAAAFLRRLRDRHGSWIDAVRRYHAGDADAQNTYLCRVLSWRVRLGYQQRTADMDRQCGVSRPSVAEAPR